MRNYQASYVVGSPYFAEPDGGVRGGPGPSGARLRSDGPHVIGAGVELPPDARFMNREVAQGVEIPASISGWLESPLLWVAVGGLAGWFVARQLRKGKGRQPAEILGVVVGGAVGHLVAKKLR